MLYIILNLNNCKYIMCRHHTYFTKFNNDKSQNVNGHMAITQWNVQNQKHPQRSDMVPYPCKLTPSLRENLIPPLYISKINTLKRELTSLQTWKKDIYKDNTQNDSLAKNVMGSLHLVGFGHTPIPQEEILFIFSK